MISSKKEEEEKKLVRLCEHIYTNSRVNDKIVVLCEGQAFNPDGAYSPGKYQDAIFYQNCVPTWWDEHPRPQFFNCGDQHHVISVFLKLHELAPNDPRSRLNLNKLFAWIDADIQVRKIKYDEANNSKEIFKDIYQDEQVQEKFKDSEEIFKDIHLNGQVQEERLGQHHIWVTSLIHKEAYFLLPLCQSTLQNMEAAFQNQPINLETVYSLIAQESGDDRGLVTQFSKVCHRVPDILGLNLQDVNSFQQSWLQHFAQSTNNSEKEALINALFSIRKVKPYWKQIQKLGGEPEKAENFRTDLSLQIARLYSQQDRHSPHHLPTFFKVLHQTIYG